MSIGIARNKNQHSKNAMYKKEMFPVLEMTCGACAISVESMLKSIEGVKNVSVNFANQEAWVEYNPAIATPQIFQHTIRSIGYDLIIERESQQEATEAAKDRHYRSVKNRTIWASILSLPIVIIGMFFMDMPIGNWIMMILATPVVFYFGRSYFFNAWKQARFGKANMDTLVALSTGIAWLFSAFNTIFPEFWHSRGMHAHVYFEAATVIIAFISLGKLLEEKAKSNTSSAIKKLIGLQPRTVTRLLENKEAQEMAVEDVKPGFRLLVKPGEKIPVDGSVTQGYSFVNESMISGEPIPVEKKPGEKIFAGTINQRGSLIFQAEKVGSETLLAQIIKLVQEAQGSKAPVQKLVDKVAGVFVPIVILISILTFVAWIVFGGDNAFTQALLTAVSVLVIACPCALGLATPTAIMVGVGKGAENNILIKDAESLELAHKVNVVILDKTGTITEGKPIVTAAIFPDNNSKEELISILLALESQSEHPLAEAIVDYLMSNNVKPVTLDSFESITGKGVIGTYKSNRYLVGNFKFLKEYGVEENNDLLISNHIQDPAMTVVAFSENNRIMGLIGITDKVKPGSKDAIKALLDEGIEVYMLTGDSYQTASSIAKEIGLRNFKAEILPAQKAEFVKELQEQGKTVAMVGDGINDSHALAQADVSIAMGKGSDIAMDVAKMTLITSDLKYISKALKLSGKTIKTVRQNLFWAFIYNLIGIPIAAGVLYPINGFLLDPMIAGAAMALSSLSVVGNSLRLKRLKL